MSLIHLTRKYGVQHGLEIARNTRRWENLTTPRAGWNELLSVGRVLRNSRWGGDIVQQEWDEKARTPTSRFAERFASLQDAAYAICTSNGTTALQVAYQALGLKRGDEIIVPALTFSATAGAALALGVKPVFADVDPQTLCIDPDEVEKKITDKTKAVVVVHLGTQLADLDRLRHITSDKDIYLVEDCAHAHGAQWGGRGVGAVGDIGCFSFQESKTVTAGEGGIVTTNDRSLADRARAYVNCGRVPEGAAPHSILGSNHRMTNLQGALLLGQLKRFEQEVPIRQKNLTLLSTMLEELPGLHSLVADARATRRVGYIHGVRYVESEGPYSFAEFCARLADHGVPMQRPYPPVYEAPEFGWRDAPIEVDYSDVSCPVAEAAAREVIWLKHGIMRGESADIIRLAETIRHVAAGSCG